MAKWNEVLRIEDALGADGRFAGVAALPPENSIKGLTLKHAIYFMLRV